MVARSPTAGIPCKDGRITGASCAEQPAEGVISVLIVDDQEAFRAAARAVVRRAPGLVLVGEAASGEEAVALSQRLGPDLVLMDINMGGLDGIDAARLITTERPGTLVILMSTYSPEELPPRARSSGAAAYVNKDELSPRVVRRLLASGGDSGWRRSPS